MTDNLIPARREEQLPATAQQNPMSILQLAVERGIDVGSIERLAALVEHEQKRQAEIDFTTAFVEFKRKCPTIVKTKAVHRASDKGGDILYCFAPLPEIEEVVKPILLPLGFVYWWGSESTDEAKWITTTCFLQHIGGHLRTATFKCLATEGTTIMSGPQKAASAWSFGRRQTLTAVLGITTADADTDGSDHDPTTITREQAAQIEDLISASGADRDRLLLLLHVGSVAEISGDKFDLAVRSLKAKMERKS